MPQLVPFYYINQVIFAFILIMIIIYVCWQFILPRFVRLFKTRIFLSKKINNFNIPTKEVIFLLFYPIFVLFIGPTFQIHFHVLALLNTKIHSYFYFLFICLISCSIVYIFFIVG